MKSIGVYYLHFKMVIDLFYPMYEYVNVDKKWFYITKKSNYYLVAVIDGNYLFPITTK